MFWIIKKSKRQKGFTFIELMLVVSMIAMLSAMTIPISFGSLKKQSVEEEASQLLSVLRQTQAKSMKGRDDSPWGVYFTPETYTSFKGNSYEERDPLYDEVFELYSNITIAGAPEIVFDNSGKPQIEGLVGHWTMNEGEGGVVHDLSSNSNHGVLVNGPSWVDGKIGGALEFDGASNYVEIVSPAGLDFQDSTQFTVGGWIYWKGATDRRYIWENRGASGGAFYVVIIDPSNILKGIGAKEPTGETQVTTAVSTNVWLYFTAVFNKDIGKIELFVDGELKDDVAWSPKVGGTSSGNKYIGDYFNRNFWFNGQIDDVRIYNRALSPEEIRLIYESGLDGVDDNIIELSDGSDSVKINVGRQGRIEVVR